MIHINELLAAFQKFQGDSIRALREHPTMSPEQTAAFNKARAELQDTLAHAGLAKHIDWTEK